jgi:hypothetical protein
MKKRSHQDIPEHQTAGNLLNPEVGAQAETLVLAVYWKIIENMTTMDKLQIAITNPRQKRVRIKFLLGPNPSCVFESESRLAIMSKRRSPLTNRHHLSELLQDQGQRKVMWKRRRTKKSIMKVHGKALTKMKSAMRQSPVTKKLQHPRRNDHARSQNHHIQTAARQRRSVDEHLPAVKVGPF